MADKAGERRAYSAQVCSNTIVCEQQGTSTIDFTSVITGKYVAAKYYSFTYFAFVSLRLACLINTTVRKP